MGKCVCTTNEEVRKCMANCDTEPRKKKQIEKKPATKQLKTKKK